MTQDYSPIELMFTKAAKIAQQQWDAEADADNKWQQLGRDEKHDLIKQVILDHIDYIEGGI